MSQHPGDVKFPAILYSQIRTVYTVNGRKKIPGKLNMNFLIPTGKRLNNMKN